MKYPDFFERAPKVTLRDPLSAFLGSFEDGVIEYCYLDAVKLAGHSCPTVAGTYLMTVKALKALWGDGMPERGAVRVSFPAAQDEGVTGVMASVTTLVTGAAAEGGFKGIGPLFDRSNLLSFDAGGTADIVFERIDTGATVAVTFDAGVVPLDPAARELIGKQLQGAASAEEAERFQALWQGRVEKILTVHADDPDMIVLG